MIQLCYYNNSGIMLADEILIIIKTDENLIMKVRLKFMSNFQLSYINIHTRKYIYIYKPEFSPMKRGIFRVSIIVYANFIYRIDEI